MRLALVGASLVLAGLTAACGGDSGGASSSADKDEFCEAWKKTGETVMTSSDDFDKVKGAYEDAFEIGTPESISDDAREGFEIMEDAIKGVDSQKELEDMEEPSEGDSEKVEKFTTYLSEECGDALAPDAPESGAPAE